MMFSFFMPTTAYCTLCWLKISFSNRLILSLSISILYVCAQIISVYKLLLPYFKSLTLCRFSFVFTNSKNWYYQLNLCLNTSQRHKAKQKVLSNLQPSHPHLTAWENGGVVNQHCSLCHQSSKTQTLITATGDISVRSYCRLPFSSGTYNIIGTAEWPSLPWWLGACKDHSKRFKALDFSELLLTK